MNTYIILAVLVGLTVSSAVLFQYLEKNSLLGREYARKFFHLLAIFFTSLSTILIDETFILIMVGLTSLIITLLLLSYKDLYFLSHMDHYDWGIMFVPMSFLFLLVAFGSGSMWVVSASLMILAFSDSAAGLAGSKLSKKFFTLTGSYKSILGSTTFFFVTTLLLLLFCVNPFIGSIFLPNLQAYSLSLQFIFTVLAISLVLTLVEMISSGGFDNFTIPFFAAILLYVFFSRTDDQLIINFWIGIGLGGIVSYASYKLKFLSVNGAVAAFILAIFIFGFGGVKWSIPILLFFSTSSLFSVLRKKIKPDSDSYFEKTGRRDYKQVLANGGIAGFLVILNQFHHLELFYLIFVSVIAAVCADTWSTEIGMIFGKKTIRINDFKIVVPGTSGGVSVPGLIAALAGAALVALSSLPWLWSNSIYVLSLIAFAGFAGSIVDSYVGANFQVQYKCGICSTITERKIHCGKESAQVSGKKWINNDLVNLLSGGIGGLLILIFYRMI